MQKIQKFSLILIIIVFFMHGLLYYLFPNLHYLKADNIGWVALIKYICVAAYVFIAIRFRFKLYDFLFLCIGLFLLVSSIPATIFWSMEFNLLLAQFQFPIIAFFLAGSLIKVFESKILIKKIIFVFVLVSLVFFLFDLIFFSEVARIFGRGGFRSAGPFVNPNNAGIVVALMAATFHFFEKRLIINFVLGFIAIFAIVLTGSKTAIIIYTFSFMFIGGFSLKLFLLPVISLTYLAVLYLFNDLTEVFELREFTLISGEIRFGLIAALVEKTNETDYLGVILGFTSNSFVDNAYFDIFSFGGLSLLIPFMVIQFLSLWICIVNRYKLILMLHFMLFLAMLTTNVPRLWPVGYIYWTLVGLSFYLSMRNSRNFFHQHRIHNFYDYKC